MRVGARDVQLEGRTGEESRGDERTCVSDLLARHFGLSV